MTEPKWGPAGRAVYERTYQRVNPDGTRETWDETVTRVVNGNLSLVYGPPEGWGADVRDEARLLYEYMSQFKILPAGRHLWASGVPGRQFLFNCHVAGWSDKLSDHFRFTFLRLMEGGGVGANYSTATLARYGPVRRTVDVHIVCDPEHPDHEKMREAGLISADYSYGWAGAYPVEDSREGWAAALTDLIDAHMAGVTDYSAQRVYDVSRVRPQGAPLRTFGGTASGPLPFARMLLNVSNILNRRYYAGWEPEEFEPPVVIPGTTPALISPLDAMEIDHEIGACVVAGGNRRSARMSMVDWDDPHVFEFIRCKRDPGTHWTTNISVAIDREFSDAVAAIGFTGVGTVEANTETSEGRAEWARRVLHEIVEGMLTNGEPGIWNRTLSNVGEPNEVVCTNPCGEIALEPWENCNLGHVNMDAFASEGPGRKPDLAGLKEAHRLMTRFLIRATYGDVSDPRQAEVLARNRRIGVGHFGVQGFLAKWGLRYSDAPNDMRFRGLLSELYRVVRATARDYAFQLRIPEPVKVTTVAPTGTIAKLPGTTEGIHPVYARHFIRRIRFSDVDPDQRATVDQYAAEGYTVEPCQYAPNTWVVEIPTKETLVAEVEQMGLDAARLVESADEITLNRMLAFQALYQRWYADNAVSFTINIPEGRYSVSEVAKTLASWLPYLKGTTLMPDGTRPQAPYERITAEQWELLAGPKEVADSVDEDCTSGACPIR